MYLPTLPTLPTLPLSDPPRLQGSKQSKVKNSNIIRTRLHEEVHEEDVMPVTSSRVIAPIVCARARASAGWCRARLLHLPPASCLFPLSSFLVFFTATPFLPITPLIQ